jgi:mono/diheme cytochrome c family protein
MSNRSFWISALALGTLVVALACSDAKGPASSAGQTSSAAARPAAPAAQSGAVAAPPADSKNEPATVAEIFPAGQGRDVVLNNCGSCHNLACSAIGQRTAARWDSLRESHKDKISDADAATAFAYLKSNFNDAKPEPKVPAKFMQGGCTPF